MSQLTSKFANILIDIANDITRLKELANYLDIYIKILEENKVLMQFFTSPLVSQNIKMELFTKISDRCFTKKNKTITNLITILIKLKKIKLLNEISQLINSHIIKINGFTETIVVFASNPSVKQLKMVEEILEGEFSIKPKINLKIDKDVLAGFHAFFDGKMLDASLYKSFANLATARIQ